jgi:HNH endonuclease
MTQRQCSSPGCERLVLALDLCSMHYERQRKNADMLAPRRGTGTKRRCSIPGCGKPYVALGFCRMHYFRHYKGVDMLAPPRGAHTICSAEGCNRPSNGGLGFCTMHYQRHKNGSDMLASPRIPNGASIAFVDEAARHTGTGCLIWPYSRIPQGYGHVRYPGHPGTAAHVVCELAHGQAPTKDHDATHSCRNRACVAPAHLRWGTHR